MWYDTIIYFLSYFFAGFGVLLIFYGGLRAIIKILAIEVIKRPLDYDGVRLDFTRKILMALDFFIAADLISSILKPSLNDVIVLAIIVAIRTVVSFSLNKEMELLSKGK
jgi:uncharacterized membrane protein